MHKLYSDVFLSLLFSFLSLLLFLPPCSLFLFPFSTFIYVSFVIYLPSLCFLHSSSPSLPLFNLSPQFLPSFSLIISSLLILLHPHPTFPSFSAFIPTCTFFYCYLLFFILLFSMLLSPPAPFQLFPFRWHLKISLFFPFRDLSLICFLIILSSYFSQSQTYFKKSGRPFLSFVTFFLFPFSLFLLSLFTISMSSYLSNLP